MDSYSPKPFPVYLFIVQFFFFLKKGIMLLQLGKAQIKKDLRLSFYSVEMTRSWFQWRGFDFQKLVMPYTLNVDLIKVNIMRLQLRLIFLTFSTYNCVEKRRKNKINQSLQVEGNVFRFRVHSTVTRISRRGPLVS